MTKEDILQQCIIEDKVVKLPAGQLDRKLYMEVAKALELIGGKWVGRKIQGFVFPHDPTDLLAQIANGEKRNLKKEYQFFATPDKLADVLVNKAFRLPCPIGKILEPSAGQGAIINAIHRYDPDLQVFYLELMDINREFLKKIDNTVNYGTDFMEFVPESEFGEFAIIVANPPFTKNQDIDHILKMYDCLESGGRMVSIASKHWTFASGKKEDAFRKFLESVEAEIEEIPEGEFKSSGTMVASLIITINKL
jgi:hypothetical protein